MISPLSVYGKYFLGDAIIALAYSHAPFSAKAESGDDLYDYSSDISPYSIVCHPAYLPDSKDVLRHACELISDTAKHFGDKNIFCADGANFHYSDRLLKTEEHRMIQQKIEV